MREYWKVVFYDTHGNQYCGSERFDAKWKADKYAENQVDCTTYAEVEHWKQESTRRIPPKEKKVETK